MLLHIKPEIQRILGRLALEKNLPISERSDLTRNCTDVEAKEVEGGSCLPVEHFFKSGQAIQLEVSRGRDATLGFGGRSRMINLFLHGE
jgi:hypothetical protein